MIPIRHIQHEYLVYLLDIFNNGLIMNYFTNSTVTGAVDGVVLTLPIAYTKTYGLIVGSIVAQPQYFGYGVGWKKSLTQFTAGVSQYSNLVSVITIGY